MMFKSLPTLPLALTFALPLALLANSAAATAPDRCAELDKDGYPAHCEPIGHRYATRWDAGVCCDAAGCTAEGPLGCPVGTDSFTCNYAGSDGLGGLACLYPVAHYCDENDCPAAAAATELPLVPPPSALAICCYEEGCYDPGYDLCGGVMYWCDDGVCNQDGTIDCFDEDVP